MNPKDRCASCAPKSGPRKLLEEVKARWQGPLSGQTVEEALCTALEKALADVDDLRAEAKRLRGQLLLCNVDQANTLAEANDLRAKLARYEEVVEAAKEVAEDATGPDWNINPGLNSVQAIKYAVAALARVEEQ
jgi:predicted nuclease with TOPRIM domain